MCMSRCCASSENGERSLMLSATKVGFEPNSTNAALFAIVRYGLCVTCNRSAVLSTFGCAIETKRLIYIIACIKSLKEVLYFLMIILVYGWKLI